MTDDHDARLLRTVASTNPDGLDLTLAEARAISNELFERTFGVDGLDDVPLVAPGHLRKAPRRCDWYVRLRQAPSNPGRKDRKEDAYELVVKPARVGGRAAAANPKRIVLKAKEADEARLEALVDLARKAGRRIRASTWSVERIEALRCFDVLERYRLAKLVDPPEDSLPKPGTIKDYGWAVAAFQKAFPELEIGDVKTDLRDNYIKRSGRKPRSVFADLRTIKRALNEGLGLLGVPRTYVVDFKNPDPGRVDKIPWTPDEYDRLLAASYGYRFEKGGAPKMVAGPDGPEQQRRGTQHRGAWQRILEFLPHSASRQGVLQKVRWLPPEIEPADGLPLSRNERPWIEVTDAAIYFHRDGEVARKTNKGRRGNRIPEEFAPTVRAWFEADVAAGREFVFHKCDGTRFERGTFSSWTMRRIVEDAGIDVRRVLHHMKDLFVEWAEAGKVRREVQAAHADTLAKTIEATYGAEERAALLDEAAQKISQTAWRERHADRGSAAARFGRGRGRAAAPVADAPAFKAPAHKAPARKASEKEAPAPAGDAGAALRRSAPVLAFSAARRAAAVPPADDGAAAAAPAPARPRIRVQAGSRRV